MAHTTPFFLVLNRATKWAFHIPTIEAAHALAEHITSKHGMGNTDIYSCANSKGMGEFTGHLISDGYQLNRNAMHSTYAN